MMPRNSPRSPDSETNFFFCDVLNVYIFMLFSYIYAMLIFSSMILENNMIKDDILF